MNTAENKAMWSTVMVTACLISGNLVGAGILGLPINTGLAGLLPSFIAMLAGGAIMYLTAVILGDQAKKSEGQAAFDYPSLYEKYLGKVGKWVAILANMLILYGLLTAYFTGGAKVVSSLLGADDSAIAFWGLAVFMIAISCLNLTFLQKLNTLFIILLASAFILLVVMGVGHIEPERMHYSDWSFLPATLPIIVTAFHFHNIIPTVVSELKFDMKTYRKAVFIGMALAFVMNIIWIAVGVGVMPLAEGSNSLLSSYQTNVPATVPMSHLLQSGVFTFVASLFALVAVCTSFLANGVGLQGFIKDMLHNTFNINSKALVLIATFVPPLAIAYLYPDIFLKALNVVGGVGIVTLFCVLPVLITILDKTSSNLLKSICVVALLFAIAVLVIELMQELDMLELKPWIEYHINDNSGVFTG